MLESLDALVGSLSGYSVAYAVGTVLLAAFIRGFLGFGASLLIVMMLSAVLGPIVAVPVATLTGIPATFQLLPTAVRLADRSIVWPFGLATFIAAPVGAYVLVSLDPALMKISISIFILLMVLMIHRGWRIAQQPGSGMLLVAGAISGLVQGSAGVGGPPAVAVALSCPGTSARQRANVIGAVAALSLCGVPAYWLHDLYTWEVVIISVVLAPLYVGAIWAGARYFTDSGHRHYRLAALLTLAIIGVITLGLAVRDYLPG